MATRLLAAFANGSFKICPRKQYQLQLRTYSVPLRPKNMKFAKFHKRLKRVRPVKPDNVVTPKLHVGKFGIYAKESWRLTPAQLEASRLSIVRKIGRAKSGSKVYLRVFPHIPVTKKGLAVRMGKGKGPVDHFVSFVRAGKMIFEFNCPSALSAKKAYRAVSYKLPIDVGYIDGTAVKQ